jgi:predicted CopG family antitoxin
MSRELTITLADDVYDGLQHRGGPDQISSFIEQLVRSYMVSQAELEADYRAMAADSEREREAMEWIEAAPDEALD